MTKVAKKKNRRLRRQIRKTIGALLMVSAIVVAAVPVTGVSAEPTVTSKPERKVWVWDNNKTEESVAGSPASSIQAATKNTIPYVPEDSIVYTSGDGRFQFAYVDPDSGGNKYAVILNYNANALAESSLTIPDTMEAFRKYKQTSSDGYFCLVTQNDEFMFYDVYEQATNDAGVLLYHVPAVKYGDPGHTDIPEGSQTGESIIVNRNQLYYGSDGSTLVYRNDETETDEEGNQHTIQVDYPVEAIMVTNQKPCYYEQRSLWGDLDDTQLYYQEKDSVTSAQPNGTLIHPSSQAHYRIDAIVKYIGQQFVDAVSATDPDTGVQYIASWKVRPKTAQNGEPQGYRENLDDGVFANNSNITNLQIGSNLSGISDYAFQGCATLQSVSFGNNLQTVGNGAFANCIRLSNCDIPTNSNIQALGKDAFYNCTALTSITIPIGLKAIGDSCFEGCTRLQTIDLCGGSDLDTMLQTIGNSAFKNCSSLSSVTFPTQYAEADLQIGVFEGCSNLQFVKVPNKSMSFVEDTNSELTFENFKKTVPESFYFWGADTDTNDRTGRSPLHKTANDNQIAYKYFDKEVYEIVIKEENGTSSITYQVNDQNQLSKIWLEGDPVNVVIPKTIGPYGIASIGTGCFNDACTIKRVTIPETVVRIEDGAFKGSHNLETVSFDDASTMQYIGTDAFRTQVVSCGHTIAAKNPELTFVGAMMNDNGEDTVPFIYAMTPENTINNSSQNKSWITCHSGFPTNMEVKYVYDFTTDTGSAQMQSYPRYDLYGDSSKLTDWVKELPYVDETNSSEVQSYVAMISEAYEKYTKNNSSDPPTEEQMQIINAALNVVVPTNVDSLKPGLFSGYKADSEGEAALVSGMTPDTRINSIVLNGVDEIEPFTFTGCSSLKNVSVIKAGKIGDYAFGAVENIDSSGHVTTEQNCDALEQVTLGSNIVDVGKRPFRGCTNLNTITCLGDNLSYQDGVLYQPTGSGKILLECLESRGDTVGSYTVGPDELSGVTEIQEEAFMNCDSIGKVDLSDTTVSDIPERVFYDAEDLNTVILPDTVKNIEAESFQNSGIRVLTIPGNQAYIEKDAFKNSEQQQTITFECVQGTTADRYAKEYSYINPEYGKVYVEHTVFFWDYPDYPDTSTKTLFYKVKVRDGEDAVPPTETPTHEGYLFSGWTDYTNISKDTDVWPSFGSNIYKVEFLDWDGTVISQTGFTNPQYIEEGKSATPPPTDPTREGFTFAGWTPDYHDVSKDLTVIAKYTDNSGDQSRHTVTFYAYENNQMTAISVQKVNDGEAAVAPAVPARTGYTFTGWYPDKSVFSKVTADLTIVASYEKNSASSSTSPNSSASKSASPSPSSTSGSSSNNNGDNTKKYTVSVSGGSGSGSYAAGAIVALNAYDMGVGKEFDKWTTSTAGVGFANAEAASTTFTMPAANVAITATYKTGNGTSSNTGGSNGGSGTSGNGSGGNSGSNGSSGSNSNRNSGTTVEVTKPGISNTNLAGATVAGSTDNFVVKVTEDQTANDLAVQALQAKFGDISRVKYLPMDISLYDSTGRTKIADTSGISVNITLPLPDDLSQYAGNNKVASTLGGTIEDLNTRFTTVDGVPCVNFTATHFSPYVIYVDTANLTVGTIDATPKTGDPIHPKWFLALGLASLSLILFFKRDRKLPKTRTA